MVISLFMFLKLAVCNYHCHDKCERMVRTMQFNAVSSCLRSSLWEGLVGCVFRQLGEKNRCGVKRFFFLRMQHVKEQRPGVYQ